MAPLASDEKLWYLKGGPTLPTDAVLLAIELEARGLRMQRRESMLNVYRPGVPKESIIAELSADDCLRIRQSKMHLLLLVDYVEADHN